MNKIPGGDLIYNHHFNYTAMMRPTHSFTVGNMGCVWAVLLLLQ